MQMLTGQCGKKRMNKMGKEINKNKKKKPKMKLI